MLQKTKDVLQEVRNDYETRLQKLSNHLYTKPRISILEKKAEKSLVDLNRMRHLKDEKEATVELHKSEIEGLKHAIYEDEVEKEKRRKQVFQLKVDLKKKEDVFTTVEKKLKESDGSFWWNKNYSEKQ
ncbi:hypothetical protein EV2_039213 [Malus domestica]